MLIAIEHYTTLPVKGEDSMEDASQTMVMEAIEIFKGRYGIKEPLDLFRMDDIIAELKEKAKTTKKKRGKR